MKIFVYLLAVICACDATFLNSFQGIGGGSGGGSHNAVTTYQVVETQDFASNHGQYHSHGSDSSPRVIKVIFLQGDGGAYAGPGGYSQDSGNGYWSSGYGQGDGDQILKVITHSSAGDFYGQSSGSSYGAGYDDGGSYSHNFPLYEILPQILQIIMQFDGRHGGNIGGYDDVYSQLVTHFGEKGSGVAKRIYGHNDYFSSGHVIEKGELKISPIHGHAW